MKTQLLLPPSSISKYVSSIFIIENHTYTGGFVLPLYANGAPTVVFQTANASRQNRTVGNLTLYGQTILPDALHFDGAFTMVAYFLHPHALNALFGIEGRELTDECIDLNDLKQARAMGLQEQLLNASSLSSRLHLINSFIQGLGRLDSDDYERLMFATNELKEISGVSSLADLQEELNITERSLQRLFKKHVGISPRMYKRVCQFRAAFQQVNQGRFSKLTDIAYQNGFADQSHFTRVFKEFTGLTPTGYLRLGKDL